MTDTNQETPPEQPKAEAPKTPPQPKPIMKTGAKVMALVPTTIEEAARVAEGLYHSGMTPDSYIAYFPEYRDVKNNLIKDHVDERATKARLLIGIMKGMEVGLPPVAAISGIYIVNNRPTIYGDAALALVQNSDKYEWHKEWFEGQPKTDTWTAYCEIKRVGIDEPIRRSFTWAQAKAAGLAGKSGPWSKYPERQMQMRARAFTIRDGFADVMSGLGITEEVRDIDTPVKEQPKAEIQQDPFTMKALESRQEVPVDFSTLVAKQPEPVRNADAPMESEQKQELSEAVEEEVTTAEPVTERPQPTLSQGFPGCKTCDGTGKAQFKGPEGEGEEPCPDCMPDTKPEKPDDLFGGK